MKQVLSMQQVFDLQKGYAEKLKHTTAQERIEKLKKLEKLIIAYQPQIEEAIRADFGKPPIESMLTEIISVISELRHTIKNLKDWLKPKKVGQTLALFGTSGAVYVEPKGLALIISPWNYPFNLAINPLISAIAAGCAVILKPSELSSNTSALLAKMLGEFTTQEEIAVFEGGVEVSTSLLALPFDHIFFTGSPAIGKVVMHAAAEHLTSVTLELGGKSPAIIDETADLQDVAEKLVWGKFVNAGQTCIAPDYALVKHEIKEKFIEAVEKQLDKCYNADKQGVEKSDSFSRIINEGNFLRLSKLLEDATEKGAKIAIGGQTDRATRYIAPTLLTETTMKMKIMEEEIFGPILPIVSYQTSDDALKFIAKLPKPLAFYIFSRDKSKIEKYISHSTAGGTCVNDCLIHIAHPDLPFGGVNNSGIGRSHGLAGFLEFCNQRSVLKQRVGFTSLKLVYPPYTEKVRNIVKMLLNWV
jgi:aldehyde dehydrogenase (NAD+)